MIDTINVYDPTRTLILVSDIPKERELSDEEKVIRKLSDYISKLDDIYVNSTILSLVALIGILFNICVTGVIYTNWFAVLISLVIPSSIYLIGIMAYLISRYLWHKKVKLESKLSRW